MWKQEIPPPQPVAPDHIFEIGGLCDGLRVTVNHSVHSGAYVASLHLSRLTMLWDEKITDLDAAKLAALAASRNFVAEQLAKLDAAIAAMEPAATETVQA
jgi:hypothetical protein